MANSSTFDNNQANYQLASPRHAGDKPLTGVTPPPQGRVISTSKLSGFVLIRSSTRAAKPPTGSTK